jgi:hypothetical protein
MDSLRKRSTRRRRCGEVEDFLQSRLYLSGAFAAVLAVCAAFYLVELVLPRHWAVAALLRLIFFIGLGLGGRHVYTQVVLPALQSSAERGGSGGGEGEEEGAAASGSAVLDAAAREAAARAALEAANRSAEELLREEEEEEARARAAEAQRKAAAAAQRKGNRK